MTPDMMPEKFDGPLCLEAMEAIEGLGLGYHASRIVECFLLEREQGRIHPQYSLAILREAKGYLDGLIELRTAQGDRMAEDNQRKFVRAEEPGSFCAECGGIPVGAGRDQPATEDRDPAQLAAEAGWTIRDHG